MAGAVVKDQPEAAAPLAGVNPVQENGAVAENGKEIKTEDMSDAAALTNDTAATAAQNDEKNPNLSANSQKKEEMPDPVAIQRQVEFYLGDVNLPTDKFLWETTGGPKNNPVPLKTICTFKRMHRFSSYKAIVEALKESKILVLAGEDGNETIQRKTPYVPEPLGVKKRMEKSVYIKGFGEEEDENTQDQILTWLSSYGSVDRIKMRREDKDKSNPNKFKGSIFAEFSTPELAQAFVKLSPAPKYQDKELQIMMKADYIAEKKRQIDAGEIEPSKGRVPFYEGRLSRGNNRGRGRGNHNSKRNKDDGKKHRDNDHKNGFKGGRGGRGFRGRGRGGGLGRGGRDNNDRENALKSSNNVKMPTIQATNDKGEAVGNGAVTNGKRSREEDSASASPAKKVDTKTETVTA